MTTTPLSHPEFHAEALDALVAQFDTGRPQEVEATTAYLQAFEAWLDQQDATCDDDRRLIAGHRSTSRFLQANLAIVEGAVDRGLRLAMESADSAQVAGDTHRAVRALCLAARCSEDLGMQAESTRHITMALDLAEQLGDERTMSWALLGLCYLYDSQGAHEKLLDTAEQVRAIAHNLDDANTLVRSLNALSLACGFLDRHDEALAWANEALEACAARGMTDTEQMLKFNLVFHYTSCGRPEQAIELAAELEPLMADLAPQQAAVIHVDIAQAYMAAGDYDTALDVLQRAADDGDLANRHVLRYYEVAADLHEAMGDEQQALEMLHKYLACEREVRGREADTRLVVLERHFTAELAAKTAEIYHLRSVELVEKNAALEQAAREREELLQILVQDLQLPLSKTKRLSHVLLEELPSDAEIDLIERLQFIDAAAAEMRSTIETLLDDQWSSVPR